MYGNGLMDFNSTSTPFFNYHDDAQTVYIKSITVNTCSFVCTMRTHYYKYTRWIQI